MATPSHPPETPELSHSGERDAPNRRSFFGRALSDAAVRARIPTLHSTMSSQSALPHPPRPETSLSSTRRRKTEPLQQIRDSIFGARKKTAPPASRDVSSPQESWPLPRSDDVGRPGVLLSCDHFRSEQECKTTPPGVYTVLTQLQITAIFGRTPYHPPSTLSTLRTLRSNNYRLWRPSTKRISQGGFGPFRRINGPNASLPASEPMIYRKSYPRWASREVRQVRDRHRLFTSSWIRIARSLRAPWVP